MPDARNAARGVPAPAVEPAQTPKAAEGTIVSRAGTAKGCLPKHADHPDVRAAIEALASLELAEVTDRFGYDPNEDGDVRGALVVPRESGRVAVYWFEGGWHRKPDGEPRTAELNIIADKLRKAGWTVETETLVCALAWSPTAARPVVMPTDPYEYEQMRRENPRPGPCCETAGPVDHWPSFRHCGGGNGPGLPIRPHCTCDSCF